MLKFERKIIGFNNIMFNVAMCWEIINKNKLNQSTNKQINKLTNMACSS